MTQIFCGVGLSQFHQESHETSANQLGQTSWLDRQAIQVFSEGLANALFEKLLCFTVKIFRGVPRLGFVGWPDSWSLP